MTRQYAHKVDGNQGEIVTALRQSGHQVVVLSRVGDSVPDLLVGRAGLWWLCENKADKGKLSTGQVMFLRGAQGPVIVARTAQEAIDKGGLVVTGRWTGAQNLEQLKAEKGGGGHADD